MHGQKKTTPPLSSVKFGGGSIMLCACMASTETGKPVKTLTSLKMSGLIWSRLFTHGRRRNLAGLEEWHKISPGKLQGLVCGDRRHLQAFLAAKRDSTKYWGDYYIFGVARLMLTKHFCLNAYKNVSVEAKKKRFHLLNVSVYITYNICSNKVAQWVTNWCNNFSKGCPNICIWM